MGGGGSGSGGGGGGGGVSACHLLSAQIVPSLWRLYDLRQSSWVELGIDRVPVPVIPRGRTLHRCKKGGSILKFEAPNL